MRWEPHLVEFMVRSIPLMTDREIAEALTLITGERVGSESVRSKRIKLGLRRGSSPAERRRTRPE